MSSGFEGGEVGWDRFFNMVVGLIDTTTEAIIAEIVDNSIDHNSEEIKIVLGGDNFSNFHVIVYDKGVGFEDKDHLKNAFNLAIKYFDKHGSIGKNQVGMKLSPLSNCCSVSVFSKPKHELLHRTIDKNLIIKAKKYGTTTEVPDGAVYTNVVKEMEKGKWTTAVVMNNFDTEPFSGNFETNITKYCSQLSDFLGMIYEPLLLGYAKDRCTPHILIECKGKDYEVVAKDPFWKEFTPDEISRRLNLAPSHVSAFNEEHKEVMKCLMEFGTIRTKEREVTINLGSNFDNKKEVIGVSAYVIARNNIRSKIPSIYKRNAIAVGPTKTGSGTLRAEKMSGFFFYRNGRCICFGDTGPRSQFGWYGWKGSLGNKWVRVRFELIFPESMDEYLKLSPTKDKVNPPSLFFEQILPQIGQVINDPLIRGEIGIRGLPFYDPNNEEKCVAGLDVKKKYGMYEDCNYCGNIHFDKEKCDSKPCDDCRIVGCPPGKCEYDCSQCRMIGHLEEICPTNCEYCEYPKGAGGHDGTCPLLCESCGEINCQGTCDKGCNKCDCECICPDCGGTGLPCPCGRQVLEPPVKPNDDEMILSLNRNAKVESIASIKEAIEFLDLNLEDLK